ncbi:hypothetical protein Cgig2_001496 [Carnegiea gigantea]|uniref:K-box domain-containing protein n=1 Tax=Carnegiea gigantea TaxID=171969 RepID=A0A9Q1KU03_9CARY|nr:hypothetical protein Cgig2_001496 [Carnegiea gigantea]
MEEILGRYKRLPKTSGAPCIEQAADQNPETEVNALKEELSKLRDLCQRMQGKGLDGLNLKELEQLEHQLNDGILSVKCRKEQKALMENEKLRKEVEELKQSIRLLSSSESNCLKRRRPGLFSDEGCLDKEANSQHIDLRLGLPVTTCCDEIKTPKADSTSHDSTSQMASG